MQMKRSWLLAITAGLGVFMILYTLVRHFTGFTFGEGTEKTIFDGIFIAAIALFAWNRKMLSDERKAAAARAEEEKRAAEAVPAEDAED